MANVSSYTFDNMSRIGGDSCNQDQRTIQNIQSCNYLLENYRFRLMWLEGQVYNIQELNK